MSRDDRLRAFESLRVPAIAHSATRPSFVWDKWSAPSRVVDRQGSGHGRRPYRACTVDSARERADGARESSRPGPLPASSMSTGGWHEAGRGLPRGHRRGRRHHPPVAAFEQYIKGLLAESPAKKLSFLREALRLDPTLVRARIAMWGGDTELGEHQAALAAVRPMPSTDALAREAGFLASVSLLRLDSLPGSL